MPSGGGGSSTTTINVPPEMRQAMSDVQKLGHDLIYDPQFYDQQWGFQLPSTYVGPSQNTQAGIAGLASQGSPMAGQAQDALSGIIGSQPTPGMGQVGQIATGQLGINAPGSNPFLSAVSGAANAPTTAGMGTLQSAAGGGMANPFTSGIAGQAGRVNPFMDQLASFGEAQNPHLDAMFNRAADAVESRTKSALNTRGLSGVSPRIESSMLADSLGGLATDIYGNAFESNMNRALSGLGSAAGLAESGFGRDLSALGSAAGLASTDLSRQLGAAQSLGGFQQSDLARALSGNISAAGLAGQDIDRGIGVQQQNIGNMLGAAGLAGDLNAQRAGTQLAGIGALPGLADYAMRGPLNQIAAGQMSEGYQQKAADDYRDRMMFWADRPWELAGRYSNLLGIGGGMGSLGQTTTQNPGALDYLGTGATLAAALAAFSDRRLKADVKPLETDDRGVRWYGFRYLWDEPGTERVGVMADEAPAHVVSTHPSGFKMVDYGALAEWGGDHA